MKNVLVPAEVAEPILNKAIARTRAVGDGLQVGDPVIIHLDHQRKFTQIKSKPETINGVVCYKTQGFGGWIKKDDIETIKSC